MRSLWPSFLRRKCLTVAALLVAGTLAGSPALAVETVILGSVGSASTNLWPVYIGINKGFFAAEDLKVDLVFAQSNAGVNQQLAAGSLNFAINTGLVDPIRAIEKGAPVAIVRIEVQGPPYILLGHSSIKVTERVYAFLEIDHLHQAVERTSGNVVTLPPGDNSVDKVRGFSNKSVAQQRIS